MTFALWLLGCAVVAVLSRRRPYLAPVAVLAAWVLVPEVARVVLTGSSEGVSGVLAPASWMALICTTALVMGGRMSPSPSPNPTRPWLMLLVAACFLVPIALRGGEGWAFLLDQVVAPLLVFYLVVNASRTDRANAIRMRNAFLALAVFESVLAFLRFAGVIAQPYDTMFAAQYWYNYISTLNRQMGTLDRSPRRRVRRPNRRAVSSRVFLLRSRPGLCEQPAARIRALRRSLPLAVCWREPMAPGAGSRLRRTDDTITGEYSPPGASV